MIRTAELSDLPRIVAMMTDFHAYSPYRDYPFVPAAFEAFAAGLIENGIILLSDDGMIGGGLVPLYFNPTIVMAAELFWWAPKDGRPLRTAFEAWARGQGAAGIQMGALADDKLPLVTRLYKRAGYEPIETAFLKRITP